MSSEQSVTEAPEQQAPRAAGEESFGGSGGFELDEDGQRIPHGMGQSKSSRRRRRKRKNKGSGETGAAPAASANGSEPAADGQIAAVQAGGDVQPGFRPNGGQNNGQGRSFQAGQQQSNGQNNGPNTAPGGTKRWKKKFRDRNRGGENPGSQPQGASANGGFRGPDTHQPGNNGNFKRKGGFGGGKQRSGGGGGGRSFVGPMDHSYRAVNGNFADTPPSTIETHANGNYQGRSNGHARTYQGDSQPIDYSQGRSIPIPENAPTRIIFFIEDLFFIAKIQETARKLGIKVAFMKNDKEAIAELTGSVEEDRPGLIVFDLNNVNAKPLTLIPKLKAKFKRSTSIVGFLSHLQGDLKAKAVEAGCDTVMPRSAFSQNLPNLLRRYGIEEEEEPNFNQ
jgi:hypothetical protein